MARRYIPQRGDVVWLSFDPQAGHDQTGHRPAVVVSPSEYNGKVGLGLFCPITSQAKGYPFEVELPPGMPIQGVVLSDQVRSLDWRARSVKFAGQLPEVTVQQVLEKLQTLLAD